MEKCKFCSSDKNLLNVRLKGIKKFCACSNCRNIIDKALSKKDYSYQLHINALEDDFSVPRDLLNLLYIIPYYKKTKKHNFSNKINKLSKYLNDYKSSNLTNATLIQIFSIIMCSVILYFIDFYEPKFYIIYTISSCLFSFLLGVITLDTGFTKFPCIRISNLFNILIKKINYNFINHIYIEKRQFTNFVLFITIRFPLYLIVFLIKFSLVMLKCIFVTLIAFIHAFIFFVPAYKIDSLRRKST